MVAPTAALRGKTRPRRLRRVDRYLRHGYAPLRELVADEALAVDVGLGAHPDTTLELAAHLAPVWPGLRVLGVDVDPARVATARPRRTHRVAFEVSDLVPSDRRPALIRAFNLLRGLSIDDGGAARRAMGEALVDGGLLVEGSSDRRGTTCGFVLERKRGSELVFDRLVFSLDTSIGFAPRMLRVRTPRRLRGHAGARPLDPLFDAWTAAWRRTRGLRAVSTEARRRWFASAAEALEDETIDGWRVIPSAWAATHGYLAFARSPPG